MYVIFEANYSRVRRAAARTIYTDGCAAELPRSPLLRSALKRPQVGVVLVELFYQARRSAYSPRHHAPWRPHRV